MFIYNTGISVVLILQKTPKIVSAKVASVLGSSRFSEHFEFHLLEPGTASPADDVESEADPFAYCAKPAKQENCCAKPAEQEKGCCPKRGKTDCGDPCC